MLRPGSHASTAETLNVRPPSRMATDQERYVLQHETGILGSNSAEYHPLSRVYIRKTGGKARPSVISNMDEDEKKLLRQFTPEGKAEAREGDSARARFYRRKDELLDWNITQVANFSKKEPEKFAPMMELFVKIRGLRKRLEEDNGDEAAFSEAVSAMESLRKMVDESGLRDMPSDVVLGNPSPN